MNPDSNTPPENKIAQLSKGLLVLNFKKEIEESRYSVIDRMSFEKGLIQKRQLYSSDLERVIGELKLTTDLLSAVNEPRQTPDKTHEPEELIAYYSGIYFDLVHQIKDKLIQLVATMIVDEPFIKAYEERKVRVKSLLDRNNSVLQNIGIYDDLSKWLDSDQGGIGVVLRKRTDHHHYLSQLQLNKDFQTIKASRIALNSFPSQLSDEGKKKMSELGVEALRRLRDDAVSKQRDTIKAIEMNLEAIAENLILFYKIPTSAQELAQFISEYNAYLSSLQIRNEAMMGKIPPDVRTLTDSLIGDCPKEIADQIISVCLVGSVARGEFIPRTSDLNLYVITKDISTTVKINEQFSISSLSEPEFLSDAHKKDRFICWSDGVLLSGKKFNFEKEEFPKPGALLCLLLNRGFIEKLEELDRETASLHNPSKSLLRSYTLKVARIMLDYDFGVAMTNKPFYSASRAKKIAHTKAVFPGEKRTLLLEQLYYGGVLVHKDFPVLIGGFLDGARHSYQKLLAIEKEMLVEV